MSAKQDKKRQATDDSQSIIYCYKATSSQEWAGLPMEEKARGKTDVRQRHSHTHL